MESSLLRDDRALRAWLNSGLEAAKRDSAAMLERPPQEWKAWIDEHPDALTYHFINALLDRSALARDRKPAEAVALTSLLVNVLPRVEVPLAPAASLLRVRVWMERGNALLISDDLPGALAAFERALALAADDPSLVLPAAMARRGAAFVRHRMGETGEPLRTIRADIPLFEAHSARGDVLRSRFFEAAIEYDHNHYDEARQSFEKAIAIARDLGDERMLARLYNNLGHCERQLGQQQEAVQHLVGAIHLFQKLGMTGERFRADWGIELLRADEGAATEALVALRNLMQPLIESGRTVEAALVALDVVELLVLSERYEHVRRVASELLSVFNSAQMPREALRAFTALRASAEAGTVTAKDVRAIALRLQDVAEQ
jgi:tetratricopeptide (TPR) repeat protein